MQNSSLQALALLPSSHCLGCRVYKMLQRINPLSQSQLSAVRRKYAWQQKLESQPMNFEADVDPACRAVRKTGLMLSQ